MSRQRHGLDADLHNAGFSGRTINALRFSLGLESIEELRTRPWGDPKRGEGLSRDLSVLPNLGRKGFAEVVAYREHGDARLADLPGPVRVSVPLEKPLLEALDAWIGQQPEPRPNRQQAISAMVAATVKSAGAT